MLKLPLVKRKSGDQRYDPVKIVESLMKETEICRLVAWLISDSITRKIFAMGLKRLTGPLIRELVCTELLLWGLEKQRLQYTRIGLPYYDLQKVLFYDEKIIDHIEKEYYAVRALIGEVEEK